MFLRIFFNYSIKIKKEDNKTFIGNNKADENKLFIKYTEIIFNHIIKKN